MTSRASFSTASVKSAAFEAVTARSFAVPGGLLGEVTTDLARKKRYDQILYCLDIRRTSPAAPAWWITTRAIAARSFQGGGCRRRVHVSDLRPSAELGGGRDEVDDWLGKGSSRRRLGCVQVRRCAASSLAGASSDGMNLAVAAVNGVSVCASRGAPVGTTTSRTGDGSSNPAIRVALEWLTRSPRTR
ncbi:hypothetical protein AKJ09_11011 [Labilithrix luteola]|uniref:Uncharacterized protein n=1 Tax=Labilithrix luteola TaxID=1391654 RepID=A0A0K1QF48_9BACT|nr:hypothetical protein AKJ09_11011 [Labilithrix luteola]